MKNYEEIQALQLTNYQSELNVKRTLSLLLPTAGAKASLTYSNPTKDVDGSRIVPTSLRAGSIQVSQPLLDMGIRPAYLSSKFESQAVVHQSEYTLHEILYMTSETYLAILQTQELLRVSDHQLQLANEQYAVVKKRYENGEVPITDFLRTEEEINRAQRILFDVENALRIHQEQLTNLVGCDARSVELIPPHFLSADPIIDLEDLICEGSKRRQDLESTRLTIEANKYRIKALRRRNWPKFSFAGEYILASPETLSLRNNSWNAAIWLNMPIFDGGMNRLDVKEARANLSKSELLYSRMLKDIRVQITSTYLELESTLKNYQLLAAEQALAGRNYEIMSMRYEKGQTTNIDVMEALHSYIEAQANYSNAQYRLALLQLKLKKEAGFFKNLFTISANSDF